MIDPCIRAFAKLALSLRYRIRTEGLDRIAAGGTRGVLFLPNHPALIDPIILGTVLHKTFRARFLADRDQIDRFFIRWLARRINVVPMPDPAKVGSAARAEVADALAAVIDALAAGDNVVLYPSGHLAHGRRESLGGNSAVELILRRLPAVRVVLVRTRGLWGSLFGYAHGGPPTVTPVFAKGLPALLASGLLAAPKREVRIEFHEPADLPRSAGRAEVNRYLEDFYNADAPPATTVPYSLWDPPGIRVLAEPDFRGGGRELAAVPEATRRIVLDCLRERTGIREIRDGDHLARDLGLDSLALAELLEWLTGEFGYPPGDVEGLQTVGDVLLAACGESIAAHVASVRPPPARWFAAAGSDATAGPLGLPPGRTIPEIFLAQARAAPGQPVTADQRSGVRTRRDVVVAAMLLRGRIARLPGDRVGIMLPASVAADVVYLAALLAGKTPVMVNWTVGPRNLAHCMELAGAQRVLTGGALVERLRARGTDLSVVAERLVPLEHVAAGLTTPAKAWAFLRGRITWAALDRAAEAVRPGDAAAVLFTSGSEALPKAVPLTHDNILANVRDLIELNVLRHGDRLLGILPPFHSFGLTVTTVLPLCTGAAVVHHPDPTEAPVLARLIEAYRATILVGTPTFLGAIARSARPGQLASLRLAVTGAEKCPDRVYDLLEQVNPAMEILEGYGVTECSPIVTVNRPGASRRGTIGLPLASVACAIVAADGGGRVEPGRQGMLLVRGPSVFGGYLGGRGAEAFVELDGRRWYRTGDLVSEDADGVLTFRGRLKRFVKLGGEMISLPAIEGVLAAAWPTESEEAGPALAVEAADEAGHPEIVLFTTRPLDRETVNRRIRQAGLSPLHNVRRVVGVDEIPLLGTGKTDYRALKERLKAEGGDG